MKKIKAAKVSVIRFIWYQQHFQWKRTNFRKDLTTIKQKKYLLKRHFQDSQDCETS